MWTASRPGKLLEKVEAVEQVLTHGHGHRHRQLGRGHKKTGKLWNKGAPCPIGKKDTGGEATPLFRSLHDVAKEEQDCQTMEAVRDRE